MSTLRCLRRMGAPWPRGLLPAAALGKCPMPVVTWMVDQGATADAEEVAAAPTHAQYQCQVGTLRLLRLVWWLSGSGWGGVLGCKWWGGG